MPEHDSRSFNIVGNKAVGDAVFHVAKATVDGASAFLSRICLPAAEEFGLLLQDKIRAWRATNAVRVVAAAAAHFEKHAPSEASHAHPRLVAAVVEHGSWSDDVMLQELWGGLLASSCSEDGRDDSNLIFVNLLTQLTGLQVRVLKYCCEECRKGVSPLGLVAPGLAGVWFVDIPTLKSIAGTEDLHRIDRELDHLRGLELIRAGIDSYAADLCPTPLALYLYVRCQGFRGSPVEYFGLTAEVPQV